MNSKHVSFLPHAGLSTSLAVCLLGIFAADPADAAQTNTKTGEKAGASVTSGKTNTANGYKALQANQTGSGNTAVGAYSLRKNVSGKSNTALGKSALPISNGTENVAVGFQALFKNSTGGFNVGLGNGSLMLNTTGSNNIGIGVDAGANLTTGNDNICIDNSGLAGESGTIRLGTAGTHTNTHIAGKIHGDGSGLTGVAATSVTGTISGNQITSASITGTRLASNLTLSGTTSGSFSGSLSGNASTATSASNIASVDRKLSIRTAGTFGDASVFNFDSGNSGLLLETNTPQESAGLFLNGNTATLYSPGNNGTVLAVYDEDQLDNVTPVAAFKVLNANAGISVTGDVKLGSSSQLFATGDQENLRVVRGTFQNAGGGVYSPITSAGGFGAVPGYTVVRNSVGFYTVTFTPAFSGFPSMVANPSQTSQAAGAGVTLVLRFASNSSFEVMTYQNGAAADVSAVTFIATGPK